VKAAVQTGYGPPEVVRVTEVEEPTPRDDEVLVSVHATTVNRTDCGIRKGSPPLIRLFYGLSTPRAAVLGNEFAGEVVAVGRGVTSFRVGDRVFGFNAGLTGAHGQYGAHAEHMVVPADGAIATMPPGLAYEDAAPATEGAHYALGLIETAKIRDGQEVLVNGGTGAIGSAAVQLARHRGARVTATCRTEHLELVRGLGASRVIDYTAEDFTKDDHRYEVVLDAVGKSTFGRCRRLLKPRGTYLSTDGRPWMQFLLWLVVSPLLPGKKLKFPLSRRSRATMEQIKELIEAGQFRPLIDRGYPLDQIVEAYRYVDSGQKVGGVVIRVAEPSS
jgi:NADPH:quinone reductase-like Zn-dependent oxidoreductase